MYICTFFKMYCRRELSQEAPTLCCNLMQYIKHTIVRIDTHILFFFGLNRIRKWFIHHHHRKHLQQCCSTKRATKRTDSYLRLYLSPSSCEIQFLPKHIARTAVRIRCVADFTLHPLLFREFTTAAPQSANNQSFKQPLDISRRLEFVWLAPFF